MPWACIQTHVQMENKAIEHLKRQGFEAFCPRIERRSAKNLSKMVEVAMFPGYVLVELFVGQRWAAINSTHGVIRLLTDQMRRRVKLNEKQVMAKPLYLPERQIEELRRIEREKLSVDTVVRIKNRNSPFFDREGPIVEMSDDERIGVLFHMLGQDQVVEFTTAELVLA